ncbi:unnamed protein product [Symbiodinium sp. CCMP2592]|nr:unnamed protein product [Symbiodinium sp. CCMP2592]
MSGWARLASRLGLGEDENLQSESCQAPASSESQGTVRDRPVSSVSRRPGRPRGSVTVRAAALQQEALQEELDEGADETMIQAEEPVLLASVPEERLRFSLEAFRDAGTAALTSWIESFEAQQADSQDSNMLVQMMRNSSHLYSKLCLGQAMGISTHTVCRKFKQCASALLHGQRIQWSRLLHRIGARLAAGECEGLLIARVHKYDESPFTVRVDESGELLGLDRRRRQQQQTESAGSRAKLVSTFHRLFMVLRRPSEDGKSFVYQALTGSLPHRLHVVETVSAQNMKASQNACIADLPIPEDFSSFFKMRLMLSCTDRHSSNLAVEKKLQAEHESWTFAQSHCSMHKAADAQSRQFEVTSAHVSGMLSASISMQAAGTHGQLKAILSQIFEERLVVLHGNPQLVEHRHSLYELLLPLSGAEKLKHSKQRCILDALFNGNVQDDSRVVHMTMNPSCNRDTMLPLFCSFGVWGLLGGSAAPFFNRSKWLGGEVAISWHALLANTHGLHKELFQRWSSVVTPTPRHMTTRTSPGWSAIASRIVSSSILDGPAADAASAAASAAAAAAAVPVTQDAEEVVDDMAGMGAAVDEGAQDATTLDWKTWNRANKRKAIVWSLCNPGNVLIVMRISMQPVIKVLHALFRLSAEKFVKDQLLASVRGGDRKFRLTELFFGEVVPEFHRDMNTAYQSVMKALPFQGMTTATRGLATRMLTRAYASLHQTLLCNRSSSLVMLFKVLVAGSEKDAAVLAFAHLKECLLDDISKSFRACFADEGALASEEASAMLECIAREYDIDTLQVERGFSQIRRRVMARSFHTWRPAHSDVASECLMRHCALDKQRQEYFRGLRPSVTANLAKSRQRKERKQVQGGGAWRAYMRIRSQGRRFTSLQSTQRAKEYHDLQQNDPEAFAVLKNLGDLAHARVVQDAQQRQQNASQSSQPRRPAFDFDVSRLPKSLLESLQAADDDDDDADGGFRAARCAEAPAILGVEDDLRRLLRESRQAAMATNALENSQGAEICAKSAEVATGPSFQSLSRPHTSQTDTEKALLLASANSDFLCVPGQPAVAVFSPTAEVIVKDTVR